MKQEELKNLVIHRDSIRQMSKEQIRELNTQHGWFSNNIDDFKDFNTLNCCWYDGLNSDGLGLYSFLSESEWDYFLPVKRLQEHLNRLTSLLEIQRLQILGGLFGRE